MIPDLFYKACDAEAKDSMKPIQSFLVDLNSDFDDDTNNNSTIVSHPGDDFLDFNNEISENQFATSLNKLDVLGIRSINIPVITEMENIEINLENAFINYLQDENKCYEAEETIVENWNRNYPIKVTCKEGVLKHFASMHYQCHIAGNLTRFPLASLTESKVKEISYTKRALTEMDLVFVTKYEEMDWFNLQHYLEISANSESAKFIIELMQLGLFDYEETMEFTKNLDILLEYLHTKLDGTFDRVRLNKIAKSTSTNINLYLTLKDESINALATTLIEHPRYEFILLLLKEYGNIYDENFIKYYKNYYYLDKIMLALKNGVEASFFAEKYLKDNNVDSPFIADDFADGSLLQEILKESKYDYYVGRVLSDLIRLKLKTSNIRMNVLDQDFSYIATKALQILVTSWRQYDLVYSDYKQFLAIISREETNEYLRLIAKQKEPITSFNAFWHSNICEIMTNNIVSYPRYIGRNLLIIDDNQKIKCFTIDDWIINQDCVLDVKLPCSYKILKNYSGIALGNNFDKMPDYPCLYKTSLAVWADKENSLMTVTNNVDLPFKFNLLYSLQRSQENTMSLNKSINSCVNMKLPSYTLIDRVFCVINTEMPFLFSLLESKYAFDLMLLIRKCIRITPLQRFVYSFILQICKKYGPPEIRYSTIGQETLSYGAELIKITGVPYVNLISYNAFFKGFDGFMEYICNSKVISVNIKNSINNIEIS